MYTESPRVHLEHLSVLHKVKTWKKNQQIDFIHHAATGSFGLLIGFCKVAIKLLILSEKLKTQLVNWLQNKLADPCNLSIKKKKYQLERAAAITYNTG